MDGCNTSFLLGWPIFRGELLVLGSVYFVKFVVALDNGSLTGFHPPPHSLHRGLSPKMKTVEALHSDSLLARWRSEIPLVFLLKIKPCGLFGDDFRMPNMFQFQENNPNESKLSWLLLSRRGILLGSYCNIIQRWVQQKCNRSTRMPIVYKV